MMCFIKYIRKTIPYISKKNKQLYKVIQSRKYYSSPPPPPEDNFVYYIFLVSFGIVYMNRRRGNPPSAC
jgi:hypothetical protein